MTRQMQQAWGVCVECGADIFLKNGMQRKYCDACRIKKNKEKVRNAVRRRRAREHGLNK